MTYSRKSKKNRKFQLFVGLFLSLRIFIKNQDMDDEHMHEHSMRKFKVTLKHDTSIKSNKTEAAHQCMHFQLF